jgi:lysophospholipase L1-like esterase
MKRKTIFKLVFLIFIVSIFFAVLSYINSIKQSSIITKDSGFFGTDKKNSINENLIYNKLANNNDIKMLVIGDSIAYSEGSSDEKNKWFNTFKNFLESEYEVNVKTNLITSTVSSSFNAWCDYLENNSPKCDIAIISVGQNDIATYDVNTFSKFYESLIRNIKTTNPDSEIVLVIESSLMNFEDTSNTNKYINSIKNLSVQYNTLLLDTITAYKSSEKSLEYLTSFNKVTPNDNGYQIYSDTLIEIFKQRIKNINTNDVQSVKFEESSKGLFFDNNKYKYFNIIKEPIENNEFKTNKDENTVIYYTNTPTNTIEYNLLDSDIIAISFLSDSESGIVKIYKDDTLIREIDLYSPVKTKNNIILETDLTENFYNIKLEVSNDKNKLSTGNFVKLYGLIQSADKK